MAKIDLKYCTLRIVDGTPSTPNFVEMKIGDGTLSFDEKRTMEYNLDRGKLSNVREGDEQPMDVKFDLMYEFLKATSATVPTPEQALKKTGPASTWTSTSSDACEPYAVDIYVIYAPPCGGEKMELAILPDFRWESLNHDLKAGTISCSGKCNAKVAILQRVAGSTSIVH